MIKTVIIDDEPKSRKTLKTLISRYTNEVDVLYEANNVSNGIKIIKNTKPQLVFLDISMPDGSGFDVLENCTFYDFEVIFTTAYSEYAIRAIRAKAVDYLLKPISIEELQNAVYKTSESIKEKKRIKSDVYLLNNSQKSYINKIAISTIKGHEFVGKENIVFFEAKGSYTEIICVDGTKITSTKNLKQYETVLPDELFFRTHNSYIVNLNHIKYFNPSDGSYITMINNSIVAVARRKKKEFLKLFQV